MKRLLFIIFFLLNVSNVFAGLEFLITPVFQEEPLWCWAASCEMVLDAYERGNTTDQYEIARWAVDGENTLADFHGTDKSVDRVLENYNSNIMPIWLDATLFEYNLTQEIVEGKPVLAGIGLGDNSIGHVVLIIGYTGSGGSDVGNVVFNDPDPAYPGRRVLSYDDFDQNGSAWQWNETIRMFLPPREPIPTGIGGSHIVRFVDDDCTTEITQSPQSLSYRAIKYGDSPVSWEWNLVFPHSGGEVIVASWTTSTSQDDLTWNISSFVLPTNYDWEYTYDGKIGGRIEVICVDPDYHYDAINVMYVPNDLYPGVLLYSDKTINNTQPDVRAHKLLIVQNDQFLPNGNISLKSGERIDIKDGVIYGNGSLTNLIVDPSLR
jgi:hypothetical protein